MQSLGRHLLAWGFEGDGGDAECHTQQRSKRSAQRVPNEPYVGFRVHIRDIIVQILASPTPNEHYQRDDPRGRKRPLTVPMG